MHKEAPGIFVHARSVPAAATAPDPPFVAQQGLRLNMEGFFDFFVGDGDAVSPIGDKGIPKLKDVKPQGGRGLWGDSAIEAIDPKSFPLSLIHI